MELNVSTTHRAGHAVVTATGELDLYTAPRLQNELTALVRDRAERVVVDLGGVGFCDSTGLNVLLAAHRDLTAQGGSLALAAPTPTVRRILQVTGLDTVFTVLDAVPALDSR
ncbi:STAS domain-containing protein [Thermomonospora cellulosilytica]|uniref:Anti-sigma factor antagonist n=1 Tax=Thermomonospora cellulosilytica TaxID=1411118 RepID=A0A7W3MUV4_9ACTN|nr:STAS domain-containing protein [Thermomonospora cellulosilytica]MBA9002289.1 anti-sigma B factor antagonist [Thermomonospora cellulosilytica]